MDTKSIMSYIQCLNCGRIYTTDRRISIDVSVLESECPSCEWDKGLNLGDKKEDIYRYYDNSLDERYYTY